MNKCNEEFLRRNGIVVEEVCSKVDYMIHNNQKENPIVANYGMQTKSKERLVSVADIVGYDSALYGLDENIFLTMDRYFSDKGDSYHTRSTGMLAYNKDNIIEKLYDSFEKEPMSLIETGEGTYTVLNNGLHRYTLLRILYLSEEAKANGDKEKLSELAEKYKIPASVTGIDLDKTYCKFLLSMVKDTNNDYDVIDVEEDYNEKYRNSGKCIVVYANGEKERLDKNQLLEMTRQRIYEDETFKKNYPMLQNLINKYNSFEKTIQEKFSDVIPLSRTETKEKGTREDD